MKRLNDGNLLLLMCGVFAITNFALSAFLISRSFKAQKEREDTQQIVKTFECILLIQPQDRTPDTVKVCHTR